MTGGVPYLYERMYQRRESSILVSSGITLSILMGKEQPFTENQKPYFVWELLLVYWYKVEERGNFGKQYLIVIFPLFSPHLCTKKFIWDPHVIFSFLNVFIPKLNRGKTHFPLNFSLPIFFLLGFTQTKWCDSVNKNIYS